MTCELVAIGTELLMGQICNTNAQYLSQKLSELGISVYYHTTVGDNPERLRQTLALALSRSDIVITTGGLGPTQDDLSKETVAGLFGLPMVFDEPSWQAILQRFEKLGRPCPANNRKQAYFPEGSIVLPNACGTAPGCLTEHDGKSVYQLPGPPHEMRDMFEKQILPRLAALQDGTIVSRYLRIFGKGEAEVARLCADRIESLGPVTVAPYCSTGECQLRVTARAATEEAALRLILPEVEAIKAILGDCVYAVCEDAFGSMEQAAGEALIAKGLTVSTAESCTGGLIAARLVAFPGISASLNEAHVTYANEAKVRFCGVRPETLDAHGAVSEETCREMCEGLRARSGADIAAASTGIAGPGGGTAEKPVGLVYVGVASEKGTKIVRLQLLGDRQRVRTLASLHALDLIRRAALEADSKISSPDL